MREHAPRIAVSTSAGRTALAVAALLGCVFGLHRIVDPDVFLQVVVGKAIVAHPSSLGISTFLDPYPHYPYVEDKWLPSVVVAVMTLVAGEHGLMVYQILLCVLAACAWYAMQRAWGSSPAVAVAGVALVLLACAFRLEPRPDTASHALLAVMLTLSVADLSKRSRRWMVALVMALWVNVHGYFINGLLVLGAGLACTLLGDRTPTRLGRAPRTAREQLVLLGLGGAACLLHPQGWRALVYPLSQLANLNGDPTLKGAIEEFTPSTTLLAGVGAVHIVLLAVAGVVAVWLAWAFPRAVSARAARGAADAAARADDRTAAVRQLVALGAALPWLLAPPPALQSPPYRLTFALLVMATVEVPTLLRERCLLAPMLLAGVTALAVPLIRNLALVPPATLLVLAPAWTRAAAHILGRHGPRPRRAVAVATVVAVALPIAWLRLSDRLNVGVRAPTRSGWGVDRERFPAAAVDFLEHERLPGPLLNNFDVGGYLLYRLYPRHRVFIAGSTSMYPASFLSTYRTLVLAGTPLDQIRRTYGTKTIVLDLASTATADLVERLALAPDWALVFLDTAGAVFVHVDDATRDVAARRVDLDARLAELSATERATPVLPAALGGARLVFPRFNLGMFAFAFGRPDLTLREARRLWDVAPSEDLAAVEGEAARRAQQLAGEVSRLEAAFRAYPASHDVKTYLLLALAFHADERLHAGATHDAAADARRMIALDPSACGPYCALAKAAILDGDAAAARGLLAEAWRRDPQGRCRRIADADPLLAPLAAAPRR